MRTSERAERVFRGRSSGVYLKNTTFFSTSSDLSHRSDLARIPSIEARPACEILREGCVPRSSAAMLRSGFGSERLQKGFTRRQKVCAGLVGLVILANFMFRAACPPERRFLNNPGSSAVTICASTHPTIISPTFTLPASRQVRSGQ